MYKNNVKLEFDQVMGEVCQGDGGNKEKLIDICS